MVVRRVRRQWRLVDTWNPFLAGDPEISRVLNSYASKIWREAECTNSSVQAYFEDLWIFWIRYIFVSLRHTLYHILKPPTHRTKSNSNQSTIDSSSKLKQQYCK